MIEQLQPQYLQLTLQEEMEFYASLIFNVSMLARDTFIAGRYADANDRARDFNETIHRASCQLLKTHGRKTGYAKEAYFALLVETSRTSPCASDIVWAINNSFPKGLAEDL